MRNLADALMYVLESFFDSVPREYPTAGDVINRIRERNRHFRKTSYLENSVRKRLDSLEGSRILRYRRTGNELAPGARWQETPIDQLEEE